LNTSNNGLFEILASSASIRLANLTVTGNGALGLTGRRVSLIETPEARGAGKEPTSRRLRPQRVVGSVC